MLENQEFETDLREMIRRHQVVAVVGSGVSVATTKLAPTWRGLIKSGIERCQVLGSPAEWCQQIEGLLGLGHADMLLAAAELVHTRLRENGGGELARWLRDSFEKTQPEDRTVIQSLAKLSIPLATTNYDDLIEKITRLKHVTWKDPRNVARVVRGDDRRVLHLHGHWDEPDSVVLGIRSYEKAKNDEHTQAVMRAFAITNSLLFVGCGEEGLADPNFGNFLSWLEAIETQAGVEHRHYRLVREPDAFQSRGRLYPLVYGKDHKDLPGFLERMIPEPEAETDPKKGPGRIPAPLPENIDFYLTRLANETTHLTMLGMGRSLQVELPIVEAYVPLRATLTRSMEERGTTERYKENQAEHEENVDLCDIFRKASQLQLRGVVLLGEPGSGKTTGARQLAWRLASRQSLPEDLGLPAGMTPVLLRFRNLSRAALAQKNGLRTFLEDETRSDAAPDDRQTPGPDLWNGRGRGLLWILDGLDEVVDPDARKKVSGWIETALSQRLHDWFLVTCRFQGFSVRRGDKVVPLLAKFVQFHVRPLDDEQVKRFVRSWFTAAYAKLLHPIALAEARAAKLLEILARPTYQAGHIRELCTNPLLLTILCIVFHDEQTLPTNRAELYAHCVRVLLQHWRRDLYESDLGSGLQPYDAEAAQSVLARVAWWMHQQQDRTAAPLDDMAAEAERGLAVVSVNCGLGADGRPFLERMRNEAGILAGVGDGRCGFLHLSFQEYLAAEHAASENLAQPLAARATESWWREVALLSLRRSRPFCEAFFAEMLKAGIAENHPDLAERCLNEALYFTPGPFVEALEGSESPARVAAILRLIRDRADQVPELETICQRLAKSNDGETQGFAREILARLGIQPATASRQPGVFVDDRTGITFVEIPAGEFMMGSDRWDSDEKPVHRVRISQGFALGKYPVTNAQYALFLEAVRSTAEKPRYWDDRRFNQHEQPVVGVSWDEAQAFCKWAGCRLPTEAEWEYACRAGTTEEYSFGDDPKKLGEYGWFINNSGNQTQPVGAKKPNPWGLHDMHGNVWEWCQDWFAADYYSKSPEVDPQGPSQATRRVFRGGSWAYGARSCRSAYRYGYVPANRDSRLGFRVAPVPPGGAADPGRTKR